VPASRDMMRNTGSPFCNFTPQYLLSVSRMRLGVVEGDQAETTASFSVGGALQDSRKNFSISRMSTFGASKVGSSGLANAVCLISRIRSA
jgi:hypothetical protein